MVDRFGLVGAGRTSDALRANERANVVVRFTFTTALDIDWNKLRHSALRDFFRGRLFTGTREEQTEPSDEREDNPDDGTSAHADLIEPCLRAASARTQNFDSSDDNPSLPLVVRRCARSEHHAFEP